MHEYDDDEDDLGGCSCAVDYGCVMMLIGVAMLIWYLWS
jgi:hypothetical protein